MDIGYLTNSIVHHGVKDINEIVDWSLKHGFQHLEIGPNIPFDHLEKVVSEGQVNITALTYCRNFLSDNPEIAKGHRLELKSRIQKAGELGIPTVVTSTGISMNAEGDKYDSYDAIRPKPEYSLDKMEGFFEEMVALAEKVNVKIAFENCPLMGNIAISPELMSRLFERLDSPNVGLTFDPSHLIWQFIDPYSPIKEFGNRIFHVHAKDTEIDEERLKRVGFLTDYSWWRYRLPGHGALDWRKFISELLEAGYDGVVSIEHEDPIWGGNLEKTKEGLLIAKRYLEKLPGLVKV
ncbi:sugar phosphate isomerase/epimerase [Bacillus sp. RO2]|uniref:sugar phosphate isomerase/epimerase family protein n=1 Tax=Bacillus sp. RO2 TaxID=2723913 RepID=UPI00145E81E9|nr:sugar phosphate isomerase/epimerase [Bacillus sp. RO2]NMH75342.1 sugar phosphate isomerase/epimerase [Bacillus sp. RO2]